MSNFSSPLHNSSSDQNTEQCPILDYMAWREAYLTENTRKSLVAMVSINSIAAILTIVLNALVIAAVITRSQLRSNSTILLAYLAGADLVVGALIQPLFIAREIKHLLGIGPFCNVDKVCMVTLVFHVMVSSTHLALVSVERYVAIKYPLQYATAVSENRITRAVLVAWAISLSVTIFQVPFAIIGDKKHYELLLYTDVAFSFVLMSITVANIYMNTAIYQETRRNKRRLQTLQGQQIHQEESKKFKKDNKAAKTVGIILVALLLSFIPLSTLGAFRGILTRVLEKRVMYVFSSFSITILLLSSLFNPVIYCCRMKKFQHAFFELLRLRPPDNRHDEVIQIPRGRHVVELCSVPPALPNPSQQACAV